MTTGGPLNRRTFLAGLLGTAALTACSNVVPGSGPVEVISQAAPPAPSPSAALPATGASREDIVRGFLQALGANQPDGTAGAFSEARQYLTPQAQQTWQPDATTPIAIYTQYRTDVLTEPQDTVQVEVVLRGEVDDRRAYQRVSDSASRYPEQFSLLRINREWRISKVPDKTLLDEEIFRRLYLQRRVYFLDTAGVVAVPDLRYILAAGTPILRASRVINLLLAGPSKDLDGAVRNDLAGVELRRPLSIESGLAQIDLTEVGDVTLTPAQRQGLAAQLVWSLSQDLSRIRITLNDEPLDPTRDEWTTQEMGSFDPNGIPAGSGTGAVAPASEPFYVNSFNRVVNLTTADPVLGPLGNGDLDVVAATRSAVTGLFAAVVDNDDGTGQLLTVGPSEAGADLRSIPAKGFRSLNFNRNGNQVWAVSESPSTGGSGSGSGATTLMQVNVPANQDSDLTWKTVSVPNIVDLSGLEALALSPDGVRIALVVDGRLQLGAIETGTAESSSPGAISLRNLREIRPDLDKVSGVVFAGATQLLVMTQTTRLFWSPAMVDLDGTEFLTTASGEIEADVKAVAVNGPIDAVGTEVYAEFRQRIMKRVGGFRDGHWQNASINGTEVSGTGPFFPG